MRDEAQDLGTELGIRRLDHHRPHPDDLEAPRRPQGDHRAGRRRCLGAGETTAGRDADPGARRAHRWKRLLEEGRFRSAGEIGEAEGVTRSFVNRLLRLTLLAPDIQEAILEGRQAKAMQLEEVTGRCRASGMSSEDSSFVA